MLSSLGTRGVSVYVVYQQLVEAVFPHLQFGTSGWMEQLLCAGDCAGAVLRVSLHQSN